MRESVGFADARRPRRVFGAWMAACSMLCTAVLLLSGTAATAAVAKPPKPTPNPWQMRHWPRTQPWQQAQPRHAYAQDAPRPIDPQNYELPDTMTWDDYKAVPNTHWNDPARKGSIKNFKGALVLVDYPDQSFIVSQPKNSTIYGNPTSVSDVPRDQVPRFYQDFLNTPGQLNRGHTIHEYWMEDSGGRYGIDLKGFGPYRMPAKSHEYGIESDFQGDQGCPAGDTCDRDFRKDARAAWIADVGEQVAAQYDFVFFLSAGQDESSTWQEFGQMKFTTPQDVTDDWGPPDPALPNWNKTRYVDWTSWQASANIWPNAASGSSIQAESSGMGTYAHEFSHILGIGDNYNNPYSVPARRDYSGPWEMLSRGTFNGPGGPHSRWLVPGTAGSSMGAQHMLRNKVKLGIVDPSNVLSLSRDGLTGSGIVVATVKAREVQPGSGELSGINLPLSGGDHEPACSVSADPLCDGGGYDNYTLEVVDRMGYDSFTPDSGVLLAKTKNRDAAPFIWTVDAHPEDIDKVDFVLPNGTPQKMTIGDYRQLSDALFHAGTGSGSQYEYVDQANRLHFYVLDIRRDKAGVLSYTVAVRSLDGSGAQRRGVRLSPGVGVAAPQRGWARCALPLRNTGAAGTGTYGSSDVYRLSATAVGGGWTAWLPNALATAKAGGRTTVQVYAKRNAGAAHAGRIRLTATSESDPTKKATATCTVVG
ncbi:M6 family metalloprotease domain-containing protein [Actinoallomurus spadix]|uniref:M6 family metalloprotease domain-containing protein n=1 Tax=Actinoallomurus spadix TaxID=79912 RepID=A0ABN0WF64_9ACTN|nr:M6 family metalloprotease domain-containing protein [Actinoallomurus spadix]MCO5987354.1 M6 family metalloprotease domain-containing protein [Actinoallomurus spadix]